MGSFGGGIERVRSTVWFIGGVPQQEIVERFDMIDLVRDRGDVLVCAEGAFDFFFLKRSKGRNVLAHIVHQIETCLFHRAVDTI